MTGRKEILDVFNQLRDALISCDQDSLQRIYAEDYKGFNIRGEEETRDLVFRYYRPGGVQLSRYETSDLDVRVVGETGIVTGLGKIEGSYEGYTFTHSLRFMDIFIHRDGRWQYYLSHATEIAPS
jgi:ketosteroid isomerase-like protein